MTDSDLIDGLDENEGIYFQEEEELLEVKEETKKEFDQRLNEEVNRNKELIWSRDIALENFEKLKKQKASLKKQLQAANDNLEVAKFANAELNQNTLPESPKKKTQNIIPDNHKSEVEIAELHSAIKLAESTLNSLKDKLKQQEKMWANESFRLKNEYSRLVSENQQINNLLESDVFRSVLSSGDEDEDQFTDPDPHSKLLIKPEQQESIAKPKFQTRIIEHREESEEQDLDMNICIKEEKSEKQLTNENRFSRITDIKNPYEKPKFAGIIKCKEPDISMYNINFSYMPKGDPCREGKKLVFPNGDIMLKLRDGTKIKTPTMTLLIYKDGSIRQIFEDGASAYKFSNGVVEVTLPDKTVIQDFPSNGQREIHYSNGDILVTYSNGSKKYITKDKCETTKPDGTVEIEDR